MSFKRKSAAKVLLKVLTADFMCLVLLLFWMVFYRTHWLANNIVFGIANVLIVGMLFADYSMKEGGKIKNQVKFHGLDECENFGFNIGLVSVIPSYISIIFLILGKLGVLGNTVAVYYLTNTFFTPIFNLFSLSFNAPDANATAASAVAADIPWLSIIIVLILPFYMILVCYYFFKMGYNNEDLKSKFVYKRKK
ncbi:MAG: hypothetical protein LUC25_01910 [Ruminococcus sp.]|nr:hypothetical protein [Ruminococcus sp.]